MRTGSLVLAFLVGVVASGCGASSSTDTIDAPGGGDIDAAVGSTPDAPSTAHPDAAVAHPDAATTHTPDAGTVTSTGITITVEPDGTRVAQNLLGAIQSAHSAVHMEMYLLTNSNYLSALTSLSEQGIDVKVLLNQTFPSGTSASATNASTYTSLMGSHVAVKWAPTTTGFDSYTHEKAVIIDPGTANAQVWIMTMNLDTGAPEYNREFLAKDTNTADITEAEDIFEADYAGTSITPTGSLIVAPSPQNNAEPALLALINSATTSIDIEAEEYDASGLEAPIATALETKARAGVTVRMILEDSTDSSQLSAVNALKSAGGKVVGYVYTSTALDIHAKAVVVDGTKAFVGSENLSGGSLGYNRELGVTFSTASEVQKMETTFNSDFAGGSAYSSQ